MTTTQTLTLAEFLLARIAEDEAVARRAQRAYQHVFGIPHYFTANSDTSVAMNPRVALAECEAKRRIVEDADTYVGEFENEDWRTNDTFTAGRVAGRARSWRDDTLRLLALPYADHSDYEEGWRP